jgi:hypothetical protein
MIEAQQDRDGQDDSGDRARISEQDIAYHAKLVYVLQF